MKLNNRFDLFDVSDINMPDGTFAIQNFPSNVNKHFYELSLSLFNECNLHCSFCFQNELRQHDFYAFDKDYILSIPNKVVDVVSSQLHKYNSHTLYVRIWGGELFNDKYDKSHFLIYDELCNRLRTVFNKSNPNVAVKFNFMTNGIWIKNCENILELASHQNASVGFSYDLTGRYSNEQQANLAYSNICAIYNALKYVNAAVTLTSPNIDAIIKSNAIHRIFNPDFAIEINSYIPNFDWKFNMPNGNQIYQFYKYCVDNSLYMINVITVFVQSILELGEFSTCCDCSASIQFSNNKFVTDCVKKSSCLDMSSFYGQYTSQITNDNCHQLKHFCAAKKRKCLICEFYDKCPGFCTASILFDRYVETECPIQLLFKYILDNRNRILQQYHAYISMHRLPAQMIT